MTMRQAYLAITILASAVLVGGVAYWDATGHWFLIASGLSGFVYLAVLLWSDRRRNSLQNPQRSSAAAKPSPQGNSGRNKRNTL